VADIKPFRGLRYDPARVPLADAFCPPYDVIAPPAADALRRRSPYNAVHLELPEAPGEATGDAPSDRYRAAADLLARWRAAGVLRADDEPTLYLVDQTFTGPDGFERTRRGFVCLLRLEDFAARVVLPHERTHAGPKVDRLDLLRATHANLSQVFLLYPDPEHDVGRALAAAAAPSPALEALDGDGNLCRLRPVTGPVTAQVVALLADRQLLIADGHHRYETALAYRDERRAAGDRGADWVMACLSSMDDPGLAIFPTHRLLKGVALPPAAELVARLRAAFDVTEQPGGGALACAPAMERVSRSAGARKELGLYLPGEGRCFALVARADASERLVARGLSPALARLSVTLLAELVFRDALGLDPDRLEGQLDFAKSVDDAVAGLAGGGYDLAAFLGATPMDEVRAVAERGETMPQKSTYFYPKLLTGLVFNAL
jgi:uncharacterized protein (DUF1015 family)